MIATEFDYFNEHKNWLERCLLTKQSELRAFSIQFLLSFLKYAKPAATATATGNSATENLANMIEHATNKENLAVIKKIFLNASSQQQQQPSRVKADLSLMYCLFAHVASDSSESIEFLLHELLFKLVQNDFVTKTEKVRIFSEKNLLNLAKLYEWRYVENAAAGEENSTVCNYLVNKIKLECNFHEYKFDDNKHYCFKFPSQRLLRWVKHSETISPCMCVKWPTSFLRCFSVPLDTALTFVIAHST